MHEHHILAALNAKIVSIIEEAFRVMFGYDMKSVVIRNTNRIDHGAMNTGRDGASICGGLPATEIYSNEWHRVGIVSGKVSGWRKPRIY